MILTLAFAALAAPDWQPSFVGSTSSTSIRPAELFLEGAGWVDTGCGAADPCPQAGALGVPMNVWHEPLPGHDPVEGLSYLVGSLDTGLVEIAGVEVWVSPRSWFPVSLANGTGVAQHVLATPRAPGLVGVPVHLQAFVEGELGWRASTGATLELSR